MNDERKELNVEDLEFIKDLSRKMYVFFKDYSGDGIPSFSKFAIQEKMTLETLEGMKEYAEFDRIYRECLEIRRDIIIDRAFTRRGDGSFAKFLLSEEYDTAEGHIDLTLTVVD